MQSVSTGKFLSTSSCIYGIIALSFSALLVRKRGHSLFTAYLPALRIIQIILCVAVIVFVLLQARSAGLGSAFGGMGTSTVFKTRRGVERLIFNATIVFIVLFCLVSIFIAAIH